MKPSLSDISYSVSCTWWSSSWQVLVPVAKTVRLLTQRLLEDLPPGGLHHGDLVAGGQTQVGQQVPPLGLREQLEQIISAAEYLHFSFETKCWPQ